MARPNMAPRTTSARGPLAWAAPRSRSRRSIPAVAADKRRTCGHLIGPLAAELGLLAVSSILCHMGTNVLREHRRNSEDQAYRYRTSIRDIARLRKRYGSGRWRQL